MIEWTDGREEEEEPDWVDAWEASNVEHKHDEATRIQWREDAKKRGQERAEALEGSSAKRIKPAPIDATEKNELKQLELVIERVATGGEAPQTRSGRTSKRPELLTFG